MSGDVILKLKSNEIALSTNNTVANSTTTVGSSKLVRLLNTNTTTIAVVILSSANSANLNQTTQYANVSIAPSGEILVRKVATDFVNGPATVLATQVALG